MSSVGSGSKPNNSSLGRNPDFISLNMKFSREVLSGAIIVSMFPRFLKPCVWPHVTSAEASYNPSLKNDNKK